MYTFTPSYLRRNLILHLVLLTVTAGFWLFVALPYWVMVKLGRRLVIDDEYVRWQTGVLSKNLREIHTDDVRSIKVNQGLAGRMWNIGDIEISSASGMDDQIVVRGIGNPERIRQILRQRRTEKVKA